MGGVIGTPMSGKQITILVPRDMDDAALARLYEDVRPLIPRYGLPVVIQRPYGVTFENHQVLPPDAAAYDMPDRTMEGAK